MNRCLSRCLLLIVALLSGCSAMQLTYNQADTLLSWRADNYFDFDPPQKHEFHRRIERLLAWHRREQLPEYARFAHTIADRAKDGITREDIVWLVDGLKSHYRAIVDRGINDAAELLGTLSNEQLRALPVQWAKDNHRFVDDHELDGNTERQKRARLVRTLAQISDWTGSLTRPQEQRIEQLLDAVPLIEHLRHQDRLRRQREFLELLKLRNQRPEFQKRLHAYLLDWERGRTPEYQRLSADVFERRIEFYIALEKILTPAQRERAVKRMHGFGDDFKALSERPVAALAAGMILL
jgi:hypothetical protein